MDDLLANTPCLAPGTSIEDKYVVRDVIGVGGTAVVYDAEQLGLRRKVAVKVYPVGATTDTTFLERFQREARLLARIHHENVVAAYDAGTLPDGSPYLVVQKLRGESLAKRLEAGPLTIDDVIDVALQSLRALGALSKLGITHRDVKPDNLMYDRMPDGHSVLKLVDFGVAKHVDGAEGDPLSRLGELVGTLLYMSPEQMRGEDVDMRSDLYSLGATLYQALTGRTPHDGETLEQIGLAVLFGAITPVRKLRPDCPEVLERIILKALARERECRYETASEMRKELERWDADRRSLPLPQEPLFDWYEEAVA
jgi:serine/threonine protein kinase